MTRDNAGFITDVDASIVDLLGWTPEQMIGQPSTGFIHREDQASAVAAWLAMISTPGVPHDWRGRYHAADGTWVWVETVNMVSDSGTPAVSTLMRVVGEEEAGAEEALREREQLLSRLSEALPVGVFQVDVGGRISFTNDRLRDIVGVGAVATVSAQLAYVVPEDKALVESAIAAALGGADVDDAEFRIRFDPQQEGSRRSVERICLLSLRPLTDRAGTVNGAVGCVSDVTDSVKLRRQLEARASTDALTSCLNRAAALALLERLSAEPDPAGKGLALVFLDLDHLKEVNDQFGHAAGDALLVAFAARLRHAVRDRDHVGRLGGDEFLVICTGVESSEQAVLITDRICRAVRGAADVGPVVVEVSVSAGVAWTAERIDGSTLIARADDAMYASKKAGRGGVTLFSPA